MELEKICAEKIRAMRKSILIGIEMGCRECQGFTYQCERYVPFDRNVELIERQVEQYKNAN